MSDSRSGVIYKRSNFFNFTARPALGKNVFMSLAFSSVRRLPLLANGVPGDDIFSSHWPGTEGAN